MALNRVTGVNFPLLSIFEQERYPIQIMTNPVHVEIDRALINRYHHNIHFQTVYVDLDDTLLLDGKINIQVVAFLYQCINQEKKVILLTKHAKNLSDTLKGHRLIKIFDEIIHIPAYARKADYIRGPAPILIDDSFSERRDIYERHGILTFDCSMLEILMDERR